MSAIEVIRGLSVLVGRTFSADNMPVGDSWVPADGRIRKVQLLSVDKGTGTVKYKDLQTQKTYDKELDRFQQQFLMVVTDSKRALAL